MATKKKQPAKKATTTSLKRSSGSSFISFQFTQQSFYWIILSVLVLALGAWVMYLTVKVNNIYDDMDAVTTQNSVIIPMHKK